MQVAVIDAQAARPGIREALLRLDAFTMEQSKVVYLVQQSAMLQEAQRGSRFHEYVLATIIWHEMAHLDGADERGARRAEEELWTRFILSGILDRENGLRYLDALKNRPQVGAVAMRESRGARR